MQSFDRMHLHIITLQNELTGLNSVGEDTVFCERGGGLVYFCDPLLITE